MILTCPRCATRYLVDELQVWTTGRTVKCDACGQQWRAVGAGVRPLARPPPDADPPIAAAPDPLVGSKTDHQAAPVPEREFPSLAPLATGHSTPISQPPAPEADSLFVTPRPNRATPKKQPAAKRMPLDLALAVGLVLAVVLALAVAERGAIVRAVPGLARVYSTVGLPVDQAAGGPSGDAK